MVRGSRRTQTMAEKSPPTIDPVAAARWHARPVQGAAAWLHEEVARRMSERLSWIVRPPARWCHWDPLSGGMQGHALVGAHFPKAQQQIYETSSPAGQAAVRAQQIRPWWQLQRWLAPAAVFGAPAPGTVQMLWSNMALHMAAQPQALIAQWHEAVAEEGFLMFSCLGPDTLRELRAMYAALGWPPVGHSMTDMHDWGDMLAAQGFAEPVMDMERIVLTFASPGRLLQELRGLGRNLHPQRFAALRGRRWHQQLEEALVQHLGADDGLLSLTFEVIYGHAFKPQQSQRQHRSFTRRRNASHGNGLASGGGLA